uniref:Uncharacterized protein n=1 Tax=Plectus sambesii TaxID=2011161 RepID=A0A914UJZ8_9BILA
MNDYAGECQYWLAGSTGHVSSSSPRPVSPRLSMGAQGYRRTERPTDRRRDTMPCWARRARTRTASISCAFAWRRVVAFCALSFAFSICGRSLSAQGSAYARLRDGSSRNVGEGMTVYDDDDAQPVCSFRHNHPEALICRRRLNQPVLFRHSLI